MRTAKYSKYVFLFLSAILILPSAAISQIKNSPRFFLSAGGGIYNEFLVSRVAIIDQAPGFDPVTNQTITISVLSFAMDARFNVLELGSAASISAESGFSIGFGLTVPVDGYRSGNIGFGSASFPALFALNVGQSSCKETNFPVGLTFGMGWEGNVTPIINMEQEVLHQSPQFWILPAFKLGLRYTAVGMPIEMNIRWGVQKNPDNFITGPGQVRSFRAASFHWSVMVYLNAKKKEQRDFKP